MRAVMLMGGNSAGKTTAMRQVRATLGERPGWHWIHGDTALNGSLGEQFRGLQQHWANPAIDVIIIEGVRIYSTVFRCAAMTATRRIAMASLLQTFEAGCEHIRRRCEQRGKPYREDFWTKEGPDGKTAQLFNVRYARAGAAFVKQYPHLVLDYREFWIGEDYAEVRDVEAWLVRQLVGAATPRTPMRVGGQ